MPQIYKPRQPQKFKSVKLRFLLLARLSLVGLIILGWFNPELVKASDIQIAQIPTQSYSQWGSFPVENFVAYTSPYGYRRSPRGGGGVEFHRGLDMAAPEGSYIRNWWAGEVISLSDNTACGTSITIQSGDWKHVYCHMKGHVESNSSGTYLIDREGGLQIWKGQQLPTGARIGRVGMTGRTTGPHLHWGVKYADQYIDPALVLQQMYRQQTGGNG
ncbi:M23 family metallopeptidase [Limnofasciculus baicalensis]|uniref:M23 family metallopeptidase n=1 Tax=Limnofasciculus baicalensis BBK-W-15 TaxID=2699891 RepID=A0AAE3GPS3_9CYAN|nr:M23 family metallopeptidase [Limnofasciculus baicalensis]MCP2728435.1 M23 family metallopeptidase [Limnofasciculus baicalensis BBK-W-15]